MNTTENDIRRNITYEMQIDEDSSGTFHDFHLVGSNLYQDEKLIGENVQDGDIIWAIRNRVPDRVLSIEVEGKKIYRG